MSSDLVEQVKLQYKQSLPTKAEKLQALCSQDQTDELLSFLHQLAGSAGMYGYDEITQLSASLRANLETYPINQFKGELDKLHQLLIENSK